jgi:molybdopterin-binding protein
MDISARNSLEGKVKRILPGAVNTEAPVELGNGLEVVAIITKEPPERLNLSEGKEVYAVIKASDMMSVVTYCQSSTYLYSRNYLSGARRPGHLLARP